jgi:transposase
MRFYTQQHRHYCGIDLHARSMFVCILDRSGKTLVHKKIDCDRDDLLQVLRPYRRKNLVVAVECVFCWYWVADVCAQEGIEFVLGHALDMKAIHGGKSKNDRLDSYKIASLLRGGNLPYAYVYPRDKRATRDLMRRRTFLVRKRAELLTHIQNTNTQYNLPAFEERIDKTKDHGAIIEHFDDSIVQMSMAADVALIETFDEVIRDLELFLLHEVRKDHGHGFSLLRSIPGIGEILALTLLYEIDDLGRFPSVKDFLSYSRLVKGRHESAGKTTKSTGSKIGNVHLKWAFSEAAALFLRWNAAGRKYFTRIEKKHGKGKALSILAAKLGRAVYYMLLRKKPFDMQRFVNV